MLLVKYKEDNTIEGLVKDENHFISWLKEHNAQRKQDGAIKEYKNEFELIEIKMLEGEE